jgi:hypothetical protein
MNPLSLLTSPQTYLLDPLLKTSFALGTTFRKAGLLPNKGYTPAYGGPTLPTRPSSRISNLPPEYARTEAAAGAAAEAFRPGAGFPGQQANTFASVDTPAERAQAQERSRVAQMTEQDPLFKKYRVAELTKAYNTASPEDKEKIGLEIWATTNPQLAQKLKPGQLGYTQATSAVMSQSPLGQFQAQTGDMQYANKMNQVPGAMAGFQTQTPLTGIPTPTVPQFGASEVFAKSTPIPGATEMFTDPRKFLSQEERSQTQLALLKKAFESRIK